MPESACLGKSESIGLRSECVPFSRIPGQSRLFLDFLSNPTSINKFYASTIHDHDGLAARVQEVLANYTTDRELMCDILEHQNIEFGAPSTVSNNIARLRAPDGVAVLTGQQAGLFTGPLYTIYKALTAIRSAEMLCERGVNAVPVFWIATEDHDFEEVSNVFAVSAGGPLVEARFRPDNEDIGLSVGMIRANRSIAKAADEWLREMPVTEFSDDLRELLASAYSAGSSFGTAFGRLLSGLLGKYGLVLFDPLDPRAKRLASPIYKAAIENAGDIAQSLMARSDKLESAGYHAQVLIEDDHVPLFWHDDEGKRRALKRTSDGRFRIPGTRTESKAEALLTCAETQPQRLSPGVMLRPVVQDFLFPTLCYFGGGAEIAYFAQNSEVYRILGRPVTPIRHRQSFTIIEARHARTMEKYGLTFLDLFAGLEKLLPKIVEQVIDPDTPRVFTDAEERINAELDRLDQQLSAIDPTLGDHLATRRRKIIYHIGALRKKFRRTSIEKDETVNRQVRSMFATLLPDGALQERKVNFASFADRYGMQFLDWIYEEVDPENKDHKLLYL